MGQGGTDGRTDGSTDRLIPPVFYSTLSPLGRCLKGKEESREEGKEEENASGIRAKTHFGGTMELRSTTGK